MLNFCFIPGPFNGAAHLLAKLRFAFNVDVVCTDAFPDWLTTEVAFGFVLFRFESFFKKKKPT